MHVAVLYTGALRTIRKTLRYLKQNVLLTPHVHVFACLQNDTTETDNSIAQWLDCELNINLVSLTWFKPEQYPEWNAWRKNAVQSMQISASWQNYLLTSGSMIEYLQLFVAYQKMWAHECQTGMLYDYVIRMRPDNMVVRPLDFHWLKWSDSEVERRLGIIRAAVANKPSIDMTVTSTTPLTREQWILNLFMITIFDDCLLENIDNLKGTMQLSSSEHVPTTASAMNEYLRHGSYILTMRKNNIYIVRRELFYLIPSLAHLYGSFRSPLLPPHEQPFWFNSENQFDTICYFAGLAVHNYNTTFEDESLNTYSNDKYFDADGNLRNKYMVYCLLRN
mgnify:CR=1 FL=1